MKLYSSLTIPDIAARPTLAQMTVSNYAQLYIYISFGVFGFLYYRNN